MLPRSAAGLPNPASPRVPTDGQTDGPSRAGREPAARCSLRGGAVPPSAAEPSARQRRRPAEAAGSRGAVPRGAGYLSPGATTPSTPKSPCLRPDTRNFHGRFWGRALRPHLRKRPHRETQGTRFRNGGREESGAEHRSHERCGRERRSGRLPGLWCCSPAPPRCGTGGSGELRGCGRARAFSGAWFVSLAVLAALQEGSGGSRVKPGLWGVSLQGSPSAWWCLLVSCPAGDPLLAGAASLPPTMGASHSLTRSVLCRAPGKHPIRSRFGAPGREPLWAGPAVPAETSGALLEPASTGRACGCPRRSRSRWLPQSSC